MTGQMISPLRERIIEDTRIRGMSGKRQKSHIRAIVDFAGYAGRSPNRKSCAPSRFT